VGLKTLSVVFNRWNGQKLSSKTSPTTNVGEDAGEEELSYTDGGNVS
jgi:hypothetical protein